ncbi:ParA family protein [Micrococcus luteus]|nr:ParA family protein [Micrococcus luteus]
MPENGKPLTLTLLNSKGGVGKTTATMMLAAALTHAGRSVEVWDADPQGSASEWIEDAEEARGEPLPIRWDAVNRSTLTRKTSNADVLLIDTAPGDPASQTAAVARADLVIVPSGAARLDLSRVWATVDAVGQAVPSVVLLNRVDPRTRTYADTRAVLEAEGVPSFTTAIPRREAFNVLAGSWPTPAQLGPWADVAAEIQEMTQR